MAGSRKVGRISYKPKDPLAQLTPVAARLTSLDESHSDISRFRGWRTSPHSHFELDA